MVGAVRIEDKSNKKEIYPETDPKCQTKKAFVDFEEGNSCHQGQTPVSKSCRNQTELGSIIEQRTCR